MKTGRITRKKSVIMLIVPCAKERAVLRRSHQYVAMALMSQCKLAYLVNTHAVKCFHGYGDSALKCDGEDV